MQSQCSGYLLRKFKNSPGWQRLFVHFNDLTLFFYKSHEDKQPLATLPLLGYTVSDSNHDNNINKPNVFKLTYKSHIYYFRAESTFAKNYWITTITLAFSHVLVE